MKKIINGIKKNMNKERWMILSMFLIIGVPLMLISPPNGLGMILCVPMLLFLVSTED